jgi:hypothetical protein
MRDADRSVEPPVAVGSTEASALFTVRNYAMTAIHAGCSDDQVFGIMVDGIRPGDRPALRRAGGGRRVSSYLQGADVADDLGVSRMVLRWIDQGGIGLCGFQWPAPNLANCVLHMAGHPHADDRRAYPRESPRGGVRWQTRYARSGVPDVGATTRSRG